MSKESVEPIKVISATNNEKLFGNSNVTKQGESSADQGKVQPGKTVETLCYTNPTSSSVASKVEKEEFMSSLKTGKNLESKLMPNDYQTRSTTSNGNKVAHSEVTIQCNETPAVREANPMFGDKKCRRVHFSTLVAPEFGFNPTLDDIFIMFGHPWLGSFSKLMFRMNHLGFIKDEFLILAANIEIPVEIVKTEYKYIKVTKNHPDKYRWEFLHHAWSPTENRFLDLTRNSRETIYRFDSCIQPQNLDIKKSRSWSWIPWKSRFLSSETLEFEKINGDTCLAMQYFLPTFDSPTGFYVNYNDVTLENVMCKLTVEQAVNRIDDILFCFMNSFHYGKNSVNYEAAWSILSEFFQRLLSNMNPDFLDKFSLEKRVEIGCVLLHVAFRLNRCNINKYTMNEDDLIQICNLFTFAFDEQSRKLQFNVLLNNNIRNRKIEFRWLIEKLTLNPHSLIALPLYYAMVADEWAPEKYHLTNVLWWLSFDNKVWNNQLKDFDRTILFSVLAQCSHYHQIDKHFAKYVLFQFCHSPEELLKCLGICSPNLLLAWCSLRINESATFTKGEKCREITSLLKHVLDTLTNKGNFDDLRDLLNTMNKFLTILSGYHDNRVERDNVQFLKKLVELTDILFDLCRSHLVISETDKNCLRNLLNLLEKLLSLNDACFNLIYIDNHDQWKAYTEHLLWKGKSQKVMNVWINVLDISFVKLTKKKGRLLDDIAKFYCSNQFKMIDNQLQTTIGNLTIDYVKAMLKQEKTGAVKWLRQLNGDATNRNQFSLLLSLIFVRTLPKPDIGDNSDYNFFIHLLKNSLLYLYLDKDFISSLTDECQKLLSTAKGVIVKYKKMCISREITLEQLSAIREHKDVFTEIAKFIDNGLNDGTGFKELLDSLFTLMNMFTKYQNQLRILSPFISRIDLKEKFQIADILALKFDSTAFSQICKQHDDGSLKFEFSLPENLAKLIPSFELLLDNNFFGLFWRQQCQSATQDLKVVETVESEDYSESEESASEAENKNYLMLEDIVGKIYMPTMKTLEKCMERLKNMSISCYELEDLLQFLPKDPVSYLPQELRDVCRYAIHYDTSWVERFKQKLHIYEELKKCGTTNLVLQTLLEKLDLKEALKDLTRISIIKGDSTAELLDLHEGLLTGAQKMRYFPNHQLQCLAAVNESWELIKWARSKDEKDLPRFVEIALTNVGESDADIAMITDFNNVIIGFNCLIFNLPSNLNLDKFFGHLNRLWESLSRNPNLDKQLKQSCQYRFKLEELWKASGDLEKTSLRQIENINQKGIYMIGDIQKKLVKEIATTKEKNAPNAKSIQKRITKRTLENCIELEFTDEKENVTKLYNVTELRDLHSRVMLIGTQMDKGLKAKQQIEEFAQMFDGILRLASLYVKHYEAGNILFTDWSCLLYNDPDNKRQASCCFSANSKLIAGKKADGLTIFHQIDALCSFFEAALKQWNDYLEKMRDNFPELNHFTNRQIEYLRKALAQVETGVDPKVATMLLVLDPKITPSKIVETTVSCMNASMASTENDSKLAQYDDEQKQFIQLLIDFNLDPDLALAAAVGVDFSDVAQALNWASENMVDKKKNKVQSNLICDASFVMQLNELVNGLQTKHENLLASKLESLWCNHILKNESNNYVEFLGVQQLGCILHELTEAAPVTTLKPLHGIKISEPNLILAQSADLYRFVLGLYAAVGGHDYLPTFETILMCSEETTVENINIFVRRIKMNESLFSMVDVDQLKNDVCTELEIILEDLKKSGQQFCLALIASEENFAKSPAANYLSRFSVKYTNPSSWQQSKSIIMQQVNRKTDTEPLNIANIPPEFCLDYFKMAFITSIGYGHGKSRLISIQNRALPNAKTIKIPVHDEKLVADELYSVLEHHLIDPSANEQRIFHIDILNHWTTGIDKMLFQLFILGGFSTFNGNVWRLLPNDFYAIEMTSSPNQLISMQSNTEDLPVGIEFRFLLPIVLCHSPANALNLANGRLHNNQHVINRSLDEDWINNDLTQRCFQYLSVPKQNLESFNFAPMRNCTRGVEVLQILLSNCGVADPSWSELQSFVKFLNLQLLACELTPYCHVSELPGFRSFAIKFMIQMSRDFSTRSLKISEDVSSLVRDEFNTIEAYQFQEKQEWEHKAHPYLFFNEDGTTFSFFGCNLMNNGDLIDPVSGNVLEPQYASQELVEGLKLNLNIDNVDDLQVKFDDLNESQKIKKLCRVLGVEFFVNPDETYKITSDCSLKMLAIKMRMRCGIPVVIMGETGVGKTKLIEYLCDLERNFYLKKDTKDKPQNLIIVRVHGGTTKEMIANEVNNAIKIARENREKFPMMKDRSTVLFFDEANTTPAISLIKEIVCDGTMNGKELNLKDKHVSVIVALNPYRRHAEEMIKKLESSGLGYHVNESNLTERFGAIPLRQLVYRVHPLPASMLPMVWDFGILSNETESLYIKKMVGRFVITSKCNFPTDKNYIEVLSNILTQAQSWMRIQQDETSFVSLRNVDRALKIIEWFYTYRNLLFTKSQHSHETLSILLAICVCYRCSIQLKRKEFDDYIVKHFCDPLALTQSPGIIKGEIKICQETFLKGVDLPANVAKNEALRENVFMMTLCIELRIPLFLIGKPGSSKSLAKTVVAENMVALSSKSAMFRSLKQAALVSYQCSPLATADGVETIFRQCARHQKGQNLEHYVAAAIFDEIGLAEDSPALPLKALHGLLETGCSIAGEELNESHKVAFVGISNWALDPAKMNRGIFVTRIDPTRKELFETAKCICNEGNNPAFHSVEHLIRPIIEAYLNICEKQENSFYGLRDFYSLMKSLYETADHKKRQPNYREVINAVCHNFSGQANCWAFKTFEFELTKMFNSSEYVHIPIKHLIEENLKGKREAQRLNRYLLILSENYAAMRLIQKVDALKNSEIIFGSSFPQDLEYTQICRNINKIKVCMDKGRTVILLNLEQLYESLYDLLNQAFIECSGEYFVDLGLGTHRLKCHVHKNFRLVIVAERRDALSKFPLALLNRLEKHYVSTMEDAENYQKNIVDDLKAWAEKFADCDKMYISRKLEAADAFIGYHEDTPTAIVGKICGKNGIGNDSEEEILKIGKEILLQSSTPDAVMRLRCTPLKNEMNNLLDTYFKKQCHASFIHYLLKCVSFDEKNKALHQITTHSQLFSHSDNIKLAESLSLNAKQTAIVTAQIYNTEHEFHKRIRKVFQSAIISPQLLIVQCLSGDKSSKLIASCRYSLENMIKSDEFFGSKIHVFLLISLPRVSGGCFKGFPSINWQCSHIDELAPHINEIDDLAELIGKSVSTLLNEFITNKGEKSINFDLIIKESLQAAASYIRDETLRKLERLELLLRFWKENDVFRDIICILIHNLLMEQEANSRNVNDWVFIEASKTDAILEHWTYKRSLCKFIESLLIPLLSGLITVIDQCNNLNLLLNNGSCENVWKPAFWLQLLSDVKFMKLKYWSNVFVKKNANDQFVPRQDFIVPSDYKFELKVPFFWLIKNEVDCLINELERTSNCTEKQLEEQSFDLLKQTTWGMAICKLPKTFFGIAYCHDFVLSFYNMETENDVTQLLMMWLAHFAHLDEGSKLLSPVISIALAHRKLEQNMQFFIDLVKIKPSVIDSLMKSTDKFAKFYHCLDLLSIEQLVNSLESYMEDIDSGMKVNLLTKVQKENRSKFIALVQSSTSLVKTILRKYSDESDLMPTVLQLLQRLKTDWFAAELCASFLYHAKSVSLQLKTKALWKGNKHVDNKTNTDGLNSSKFWKGLEALMKIWTKQLFEFYFKSTELNCVHQCGKFVSIRPIVLPCSHVIHEKCFKEVFIDLGATTCPGQGCKQIIQVDAATDFDKQLQLNIDRYKSDRQGLTNFFLDLVCELFNDDSPPSLEVLQILLSYITQKSEDQMTTSEVSPFPDYDAIDNSPVIRSFLLQLILNQNLAFVLDHIDAYLASGRQYLKTDESLKEFLWMSICCTEDSFNWKSVRACGFNFETTFIDFVCQNIPRTYESKALKDFSAPDVESLAKCRFVLSAFTDIIGKSETFLETDKIKAFINRIRRLITESEDKSLKFFLLKLFCLRWGVEHSRKIFSNEALEWIVGAFSLGDNDVPDPFVIYDEPYIAIKDFVTESIFYGNFNAMQQKWQEVTAASGELTDFFICCTIQQQVKSAASSNRTLNAEQLSALTLIADKISSGSVRQVCDKIMLHPYWLSLINTTKSLSISSLAFHLHAALMYLPYSGITTFFQNILVSSDQVQELYFPTMPENEFDQKMYTWLLTQQIGGSVNGMKLNCSDFNTILRKLQSVSECPNGHLYMIGGKDKDGVVSCPLPNGTSICLECKSTIGGAAHVYAAGNKPMTVVTDKTKKGHCLGNVSQMGADAVPERNFDRLSVTVCRCLLHCSMWLSSLENPNAIAALTDPAVSPNQITNYCFNHFNRDLNMLSRLLTVSQESVINLLHKLLNDWVVNKRGSHAEQTLTTKDGRRLWEDQFRVEVLAHVLPNSASLIAECDAIIANIGTKNKFYAQIYEPVKANDYLSLFWSYRSPTSFEFLLTKVLSQLDSEKNNEMLVMSEFLKRIQYLNSLQYLQPIIRLHKEMRLRLGSVVNIIEIKQMSIGQFLSKQPDKDKLITLIESFYAALKIMEPKLNDFKFSLKTREKSKTGNKTVISIVSLEKWMIPNLDDPFNNPLISILPLTFQQGFCSCAIVDLLLNEQNNFTTLRTKLSGSTDRDTHLDDATSGQLINFDADRDIYPLLMLHRNFSYNLDSKTDSFFDLTRLNRRLEHFYNKDLTLFHYFVPLLKSRESLLFDCLKRLRSHGSECDLSASQKRHILKTLMGKSYETRLLLDTLENLVRFCVYIDHFDEQIIEFAQKIHCLPNDACIAKVLSGLSLVHLPSLWQLTAYHLKYMRMGNSEDPFPEVNENCKVKLSSIETNVLMTNLQNADLLQFLMEATEFILLYLAIGASGLENLRNVELSSSGNDEIYDEGFESYLLDRPECQLKNIEFGECLQLKHSVSIWKFAVKRFAQTRLIV